MEKETARSNSAAFHAKRESETAASPLPRVSLHFGGWAALRFVTVARLQRRCSSVSACRRGHRVQVPGRVDDQLPQREQRPDS